MLPRKVVIPVRLLSLYVRNVILTIIGFAILSVPHPQESHHLYL